MKIRLESIKKEGLQIDRDLGDKDLSSLPEGMRLAPSFRIQLKVSMAQNAVACRGRISGKIELTCSRCLGSFLEAFSSPIDVVFSPDMSPDEMELLEEEPGYHPLDPNAEEVDLGEDIREILVVCVPQKPLCKEDCKGLCSRCGQDLNRGPCDCGPTAPDPQWAALANLKAKLSSE